jgi:hypothetical protein
MHILRLRLDIAWVLLLVRVLTFSRGGEPSQSAHLFLGDCYWRLANIYESQGGKQKAVLARKEAEYHLKLGGWRPPTSPAAAMAMPVPRPGLRDLIGTYADRRPPDDAA